MSQGEQNQSFIWCDSLLSANGNESFHYLQDHLGSPIRPIGEDKEDVLAYDEFGVPLAGSDKNISQPFGFTGYQTDDVTGLNYAQARYYAPQLGRFGAEDTHWNPGNMIYGDTRSHVLDSKLSPSIASIIQSTNIYIYCLNNPIQYIDSTGNTAYVVKTGDSYSLHVYNRTAETSILGVTQFPVAGPIASMTLNLSQMIAGYEEIGYDSNMASSYVGIGIDGLNALVDSNMISVGNKLPFLKSFNLLSTISKGVEIIADNKGDIIQEIIVKEFSDYMHSSSKEDLVKKYLLAYNEINMLIDSGKLTYKTTGFMKDFNGYIDYSQEDFDCIAGMLENS